MQLITILTLFFLLYLGWLTSRLAKQKNRDPLTWFFIGFLFGLFGLFLLFLFPSADKQKSTNQQPARSVFPKRSDFWMKMWYYLDSSHTQQGPFELPDLISKWRGNGISENSYVWGEGMGEWKKLSELPELIQEIERN